MSRVWSGPGLPPPLRGHEKPAVRLGPGLLGPGVDGSRGRGDRLPHILSAHRPPGRPGQGSRDAAEHVGPRHGRHRSRRACDRRRCLRGERWTG